MDSLGGALMLPLPNAKPETTRRRGEKIIHALVGEIVRLGDIGNRAHEHIDAPIPTHLAAANSSTPAHFIG